MATNLSKLDLPIIPIDGLQIGDHLKPLAAVDSNGESYPLGVIEGATENAAVVQALLDNLPARGLDPTVCCLIIIDEAETLIKNLTRLERGAPDASARPEGLGKFFSVTRLGPPGERRRSFACMNVIESMNGTIRQVCRNVKRRRDARMAVRWTGAAMPEDGKGFRRVKAHRQLPILRTAQGAHRASHRIHPDLEQRIEAA